MEQKDFEENAINTNEALHDFKIVLSVILMVVEAIRIFASLMLLLWHIYLFRIGITTYQLLVEKEELEKLKLKLYSKELTQEEYQKAKQHIINARRVKSVHKIKKSNIITPVKNS